MPCTTISPRAVVVASLSLLPPPAPDTSSVQTLLERTATYVRDYGEAMSVMVCAEHYAQWIENPGMRLRQPRLLESEYLIVRVGDDWLGFRHVHSVDGKETAEHQDRLEKRTRVRG